MLFGYVFFVLCAVQFIAFVKKIQRCREQILKEIEVAARKRFDAFVPAGIEAPYADIGFAKPLNVHNLLVKLDME